ncbi:hypothetical protein VTP01DRAFT_10446 [Rhizomucor pusillus]|uniref:uncharacterized protein n=1 Tax=Rhizomucor pusillus TaxID=4840 RepID=UPI0037445D66
MDNDNLVQQSANELAERWTIDSVAASSIKEWDQDMMACLKRIQNTASNVATMRQDMEQTRASIDRLKATRAELEATFAEIDQIEAVVQRVKETYNQVASSVDEMDKAVAASRSGSSSPAAGGASSFPLFFLPSTSTSSNKRSEALQPYFPPPKPVDIYHTADLFPPQPPQPTDKETS